MIISDCEKKERELAQLMTNTTKNPSKSCVCSPSIYPHPFFKPTIWWQGKWI